MKSRFVIALGALSLVAAACGGGGGDAQGKVADLMIEAANEEDVDIDEGCVKDLAKQLPDEDAQAILDSEDSGAEPELSAAAAALSNDLVNCIDASGLIDQAIAGLPQDGSIDLDCVRELFEEMDLSSMEENTAAMTEAAIKCVSGG